MSVSLYKPKHRLNRAALNRIATVRSSFERDVQRRVREYRVEAGRTPYWTMPRGRHEAATGVSLRKAA